MSNKTIAKFGGIVIFVIVAVLLGTGCSHIASNERYVVNASEYSPDFKAPQVVGRIESDDVRESSGIAASQCQSDVYWTHNDSGDDAIIVAMTESGKHLGTWRVTNARNDDWEDIASYKAGDGSCYLYIGDIGNNKVDRARLEIYRVKEPSIPTGGGSSNRKNSLQTDPADVASFRYADSPHNAETLLVQPKSGEVYVLTKRLDGPSLVFKFLPQFGSGQVQVAENVGEVSLPAVPNGLLTGGAIAPDGRTVILCDYAAGYELKLDASSSNFDDIWKTKPVPVDLGERKHGEAITFSPDGTSIIGTNEGKNAQIFEVKRK